MLASYFRQLLINIYIILLLSPQRAAFRNTFPFNRQKVSIRHQSSTNDMGGSSCKDYNQLPSHRIQTPLIHSEEDGTLDIFSHLMKTRNIFLNSPITNDCANVVVAQLLFLANENPAADITLYINSIGGDASACLGLYDVIQSLPCDISTICYGSAASMGALLLGSGTRGKRKSFPNSRIILHQPMGEVQGQASDMKTQANEMLYTKARFNSLISDFTNHPLSKVNKDCDSGYFMTAEEALEYGFIDSIIHTKTSHIIKPNITNIQGFIS